jgi:hypothetical protein
MLKAGYRAADPPTRLSTFLESLAVAVAIWHSLGMPTDPMTERRHRPQHPTISDVIIMVLMALVALGFASVVMIVVFNLTG